MFLKIPIQFCLLTIFACWQISASPARRAYAVDGNNFNQVLVDGATKQGNPNENIEATIQEVEKLLKSNPSLPRLTRGEILDIIDNLTQVDLDQKYKDSIRDQKAIMYVMPYSVDVHNTNDEEVEELFTKPPITKIVGETSTEKMKRKKIIKKPYLTTTTTTEGPKIFPNFSEESLNLETTRGTRSTTASPVRTIIKRRRTTTTAIPTTSITSTTTEGHQYFVEEVSTERYPSTAYYPSTRRPLRRRTTTVEPKFYPKTESTTTTKATTLKSADNFEEVPSDFKEVIKNLDMLIKPSTEASGPVKTIEINADNEEDKLKLLLEALGQYTTTSTSTTQLPEVQMASNLTPEMKDLLMSFGLIPNPNQQTTAEVTTELYLEPNPVVDPQSYSNFKPLPQSENVQPSEEMAELLAQFGLNANNNRNNRNQKAISFSKNGNLNFEAVPESLKGVISDIGLSKDHTVPLIKETETAKEDEKTKAEHVFNPSETEYASDDEINRLKKLMDVIKDLEKLNGTATEEDLKHIDVEGIKNLITSFSVPLDEQKGPSPMDFDTGLSNNQVKRQQSTTTEKNPSFEALEESFGGSTAASVEPSTTQGVNPKSGFYYLVDWNSFFDIDNQKGKRVNLRFQPTIGDPKRFFSVNVP